MDFSAGKWIWADDNTVKCDRVIFRRAFTLEKPPKNVRVGACARDEFSLFVNGKPIALGQSGCVEFDISKYLLKGENVIGFDCLYYGERANGYEPPQTSGLIVACPDLDIYSDSAFTVLRPFYKDDGEPKPSGRFRGFNSYTDGSRGELGGVFEAGFGSTLFAPASEYGVGEVIPENDVTNCVYDGVIKVKKMTKTTEGVTNTYVFDIGSERIFYPVIELTAMGTERVELKSDRYIVADSWGSSGAVTGVRGLYVCRNGTQEYVSPMPFRGSALVIVAPATVSVRTVDLRVMSYPARRVLDFDGDSLIKTLIDKCDNTMRACMDGGVLDNSDRDRGCDLLALSNFTRAALYAYDDSILPLVRDAIIKATAGEDAELKNNPLSPFACENVTSSLLFCSEFGAVASYYNRTADIEFVKSVYEKLCNYLLLWEFSDGKLVPRGEEKFADSGYNVDDELIETCLYYSAAEFLCKIASEAGIERYYDELSQRASAIEDNFESEYYKGGYYSSSSVCDERANAFVVLTGLSSVHAPKLRDALCSCNNASPAYEGFVIEALGRAGFASDAKDRLIRRYLGFIESESSVLPEYFFRLGSGCSTLSVSALSAAVEGVLGVHYVSAGRIEVKLPRLASEYRVELPAGNGTLKLALKKDFAVLDNSTGEEIAVSGGDANTAGKGKTKIQLN